VLMRARRHAIQRFKASAGALWLPFTSIPFDGCQRVVGDE